MTADDVDPNERVGEVVAGRPGRSRVFERLGIAYCCGGKTPLERTRREKGLDDVVRVTAGHPHWFAPGGR